MQTYQGILQAAASGDAPLTVTVQFDGDRVRMWSDRRRIDSWDLSTVKVQRETIFRFLMTIDEESYRFPPEDHTVSAEQINIEIDLTAEDKPRFGLADRIRAAQAG